MAEVFVSALGSAREVVTRAKFVSAIGLAALACMLLPGSLSAAGWTISATFNDSGTVTGSFVLNDSGAVTSWNIVVSGYGNYSIPPFTFTPGNSTATYSTDGSQYCTGPCLQFISNEQFDDNGSPATYNNLQLNLSFLGPLTGTNARSVDLYAQGGSYEPSNECLDCFSYSGLREFASGSASSIASRAPTGAQPSNTTAYVLDEDGSLIAVTGGATTQVVNHDGCGDYYCSDMARDSSGDLIVASGYELDGYTSSGSQMPGFPIEAGEGQNFFSIAIDSFGNYIVGDNYSHQIIRISPVTPFASHVVAGYPVNFPDTSEDVYVRVDSSGNYIVVEDNSLFTDEPGPLSLFSITPGGAVNPIEISPTGDSSYPESTGGLTFDASGNYVDVDWNNHVIYTIAQASAENAGASTPLFSDPNGYLQDPEGIYRDPLSGLFFLVDDETDALYTLTPDGSVLTQIACGALFSAGPSSVVVANTVVASPPPVYQPLSVSTTFLPGGTAGVSYSSVPVTATGGSGIYSWSIGGAPAGLSISANGVLSGTPTAAGTFAVTVSVDDAASGMSAQETYTVSIAVAPLTLGGPATLGGFAQSGSISAAYTAAGGKAPYVWSATGLPAGLAINPSTGSLSGSIAQPGNYNFTIQLADAEPVSTSLDVSVFVLGIATTSLPDGTNKIPYAQSLVAVGGNPPYIWSLSGTLPPGLALASSGVLTGTPVLSGTPASTQTFSFGVSVTAGGVAVSRTLSLTVTLTPEPLSIPGAGDNPIVLPSGPVQVGYSQGLQAAGGVPAYAWSVFAGALPDGLSLSPAGTISGTPTRVGSFAFTGHATDSSGGAVSAGFSIAIAPPALTITTASPLPNGIEGTSYPIQVLTATGGIGPYSFEASGVLPAGLTLSGGVIGGTPTAAGAASFTVTVTDSSQPALSASAEFQILVQSAHTDLVLSQNSVSFSFNAGATSLPVGTDIASIAVGSNATQPLGYSINVTPPAPWLDVTAGGGTTPGVIGVSLDPRALTLAAGTSQASIVVTCVNAPEASQPSPCAGSSQTINVTLKVTSAPPQLAVAPNLLSFSTQTANPQAVSQFLILQNAGGGTITVNSVTSGDSFVSFSGVPGTIPASGSAYMGVTLSPMGLSAGFYQSTILVNTSAGSANIPVTLLVSQNPILTLNPSGNQFQMLVGSSPGNPNGSFLVGVSSGSVVNWNASVLSADPSSNWLQLNTTSGYSTSATPGAVAFSINPAIASTLTPQAYYGTIQVTSNGLSPQNFLVVLNVVAATSSIQPDPAPSGLLFISNGSGAALPPQTVQVFDSSSSVTTFSASTNSSWLSVVVGGTTVTTSPGFSSVSVNLSGLTPGIYRGAVSYQFTGAGASSTVRTVNVTLIIEGAAAVPADRISADSVKPMQQTTSGCAPNQLVPTQTSLSTSFAQPASWPTPLTVLLVDNCSNPVVNGQIVATFSNGDPPLQLSPTNAGSGIYMGTWTPRATAAQITIAARATATGFPAAIAQITGEVIPNATPVLAQNGTLNAFAPVVGGAIAPGTIVQIYGTNLASQTASATVIPLPNNLNRTQVLIGGLPAPLYYVSPGQINAQVPFELTAGTQYQVIVNANGALSTPNPIQLTAAAPGVLGFATGQIIATHLDGSLVLETSPAAPGEVIVFYVAGMGLTNQTVASGAASPSANLATPLDAPTLTLNGVPVTNIAFAGLTPTLVGLYQVDFQIPANTPNGDLQMVLSQTSGQSNTTVLPVHN